MADSYKNMLQVNYKITIGATAFSRDKQFRLIDLKLETGLEVPVNSCRVVLAPLKDLRVAVRKCTRSNLPLSQLKLTCRPSADMLNTFGGLHCLSGVYQAIAVVAIATLCP